MAADRVAQDSLPISIPIPAHETPAWGPSAQVVAPQWMHNAGRTVAGIRSRAEFGKRSRIVPALSTFDSIRVIRAVSLLRAQPHRWQRYALVEYNPKECQPYYRGNLSRQCDAKGGWLARLKLASGGTLRPI